MSKNQPSRAGNRGGNETAGTPVDGAAAVLGRAVALHMEGKLKDALGELQSGLGTHGEQPDMIAAIGHLQCELEQYEDAVKTYTRLLEMAPGNIVAQFNQAVALEKLGKWEAAAKGFTITLAAEPDRAEARLGLGICLLHLEKAESALVEFQTYLKKNVDDETAQFGQAVA